MGTGSLDRPTTRPPLVRRVLTWRNALMGGVLAFALWGVVAAGLHRLVPGQRVRVVRERSAGP